MSESQYKLYKKGKLLGVGSLKELMEKHGIHRSTFNSLLEMGDGERLTKYGKERAYWVREVYRQDSYPRFAFYHYGDLKGVAETLEDAADELGIGMEHARRLLREDLAADEVAEHIRVIREVSEEEGEELLHGL